MISRNDIFEIDITDMGINGEGIGHIDIYTVFVPLAIIGERVQVKALKVDKSIIFAKLISLISKSPDRVEPPCKYYPVCGGCDLMHIGYDAQLNFKKASLKNTLSKMIKTDFEVNDVIPSIPNLGYRNKVQLPFGTSNGTSVLGLYKQNSHDICPIDDCLLHGPWLKPLISITLQYISSNNIPVLENNKGILRHLVARFLDNKLCVTLVTTRRSLPNIQDYYSTLSNTFPDVSLYLNINRENNNVIMGEEIIKIAGTDQSLNIMGIKVSLNPLSFFQVNDNIREKLYTKVIEEINPDENTLVIDAFSGVGLLGAIMAQKGAQIINIDEIKEAILDADKLYKENNLSDRVTNLCGDSSQVLPTLESQIDPSKQVVLLLDPPRKGVSNEVISSINKLSLSLPNFRVLYISCNPATLSRDLSNAHNSKIISVHPYDMFPATKHVETLVCLTRKYTE